MKLDLNAEQFDVVATFAGMALQNNIRQRDAFAPKADAGEKLLQSIFNGSKEFGPDEIGVLVEVVAMLKMTAAILGPEKASAAAEVVRRIEEAQKAAAH